MSQEGPRHNHYAAALPPGTWMHVDVGGKQVAVPVSSCEILVRDDGMYELNLYHPDQRGNGPDSSFCLEIGATVLADLLEGVAGAAAERLGRTVEVEGRSDDGVVVPLHDPGEAAQRRE